MRSIICIAIMIALTGLTGCAEQESAPAAEPEAATETQQISNEDFESGEASGVVQEDQNDSEDDTEESTGGETP